MLINRSKYLSIVAALTLVIGQVPFAYVSYFCTMKNTSVSAASVQAAAHQNDYDGETCDECMPAVAPNAGQKVFEPDCIQVKTLHKNVIDTFVNSATADIHPVAVVAILPDVLQVNRILLRSDFAFTYSASSPPDIPTLNSNLRI